MILGTIIFQNLQLELEVGILKCLWLQPKHTHILKKNMKPGGNTDFEIHKTSLFGLMGSHTPGMTLPSLVQVQPATLLCNNDIGKSTRESRNDTGFKFSFH